VAHRAQVIGRKPAGAAQVCRVFLVGHGGSLGGVRSSSGW
jgi:hypothetical protein